MDAVVIAAIITAAVTFLAFLGDRYREARERKRSIAAEALSQALLWLELPYRIRRRVDDSPATLAGLADRMHCLQERHVFYSSWLRVEIPAAHQPYLALLQAVKQRVAPHTQAAWQSQPAKRAESMNIGSLFEIDVAAETSDYVEAVRRSLCLIASQARGK